MGKHEAQEKAMTLETIRRSVQLSSDSMSCCDHCEEGIGDTSVAESINHYITAHGYRLLHVGSEAGLGTDGKTCHHTVAILGHDDPPAVKPPATIRIGEPGAPEPD